MKVTDIIFSLVAGRFVGFLLSDFLREWGIELLLFENLILWIILPFFSLFCLWLAYLIGKKFLFVFQAAKHLLIGALAMVVDLKIFEFLVWLLTLFAPINPLISKGISFLLATLLKYLGNKYWAFQKHEKENLNKEAIQFLRITLLGLLMDIGIFYYLVKITGPQLNLSLEGWVKLSVIFAALAAALWNFLGYKFLVFKK